MLKKCLPVMIVLFSVSSLFASPWWTAKQEKIHRQCIYPSVRVSYIGSGGSGTIIYSEARDAQGKYDTFILTNHHVVDSAITIVTEWNSMLGREVKTEKRKTVKVEIFRYEDLSIVVGRESFDADIVAHSKDHDLALLKLKTKRQIDVVATMDLKENAHKRVQTGQVRTVGCSLLEPPITTVGEISNMNKEIDGKSFWMTTAPIVFGNSGGAAFAKRGDDWVFIGVPSRVAVAGFSVITHMAYFIPMPRIYEWFESEHLDFLFDTEKTPQECFDLRHDMSRRALLDAPQVKPKVKQKTPPNWFGPIPPRPGEIDPDCTD